MKNLIKNNKPIFIKLSVILILIIFFVVLIIIKNSVDASEIYSRTIGRFLFTGLSFISNLIPISVTEIFAVSAISFTIFMIVLFIKDLRKTNYKNGINRIINIVLLGVSVLTLYSATMEVQYNRKTLPIVLETSEMRLEKEEFLDCIDYFLTDYNECANKLEFTSDGEVISPYSITDINIKLKKEYEKLNDPKFDGYFSTFTPNVKPMMSSEIYSQLQITGLTFGCFGEANINTAAPKGSIPYTMAHELAHAKGVLREDDANLLALYLMINSDDYFFRFSGYYNSFSRLLSLASLTGNDGDYGKMYLKMDSKILTSYSYNNKYWDEHDVLGKVGEFFNNLYLKSSGTEGTTSYNDTPTIIDEHEVVISFSSWQKIYIQKYKTIK